MITKIKVYIGRWGIVPIKRKLFICLSSLPILISGSIIFYNNELISTKADRLHSLQYRASLSRANRLTKKAYFNKFIKSNPDFVKNEIESLQFLNNEISIDKQYLSATAFCGNNQLIERYNFLTGADNTLAFQQEKIKNSSFYNEYEKKQTVEVETSYQDLLKILSQMERVSINGLEASSSSPLIVIKELNIKKTKRNTLLLNNLTFIEKEFIQK